MRGRKSREDKIDGPLIKQGFWGGRKEDGETRDRDEGHTTEEKEDEEALVLIRVPRQDQGKERVGRGRGTHTSR